MQLMALNALLLFDAIFIFFLFLVSVSCLLYYLPLVPPTRSSRLLLANMSQADIESALAAGEGGQSLSPDDIHCSGHDETGELGCPRGGLILEEGHLRRDTDKSLYLQQQTTVIITDPTTHILAKETREKDENPIECV